MRRRNLPSALLLGMAVLVLAGLAGPAALPTEALAPAGAASAPIAPQATALPGDDWARVEAAGKLVVGTALDNPPFTYYNASFAADGFDIALMSEIAQRLGVQVQFTDFAFEGLLDALRLKQVDVAIAAISLTAERQAVVDFSNPYYFGNDGILAKSDSAIVSVAGLGDLAQRRVAVQRGSIHEKGLQDTVIRTGQMPAGNLLSYAKPEHAVRDVKENRADLAILDLPVAEEFVRQGGVRLVGQGLFPQNYGIAVAKGSTLLEPLNEALAEVQTDGTAGRLLQQYLEVRQPPATPTPVPCLNGMAWVSDLNYDDKNMTAPPVLKPDASFKKGWRLKNSGTCAWTPSFTLSYVSGNVPAAQMGGKPLQVGTSVAPGATLDLQVSLVAPKQAGLYQGFWQMSDAEGTPFGQKVWVGIKVQVPPTPKPQPTATPQPGIQFSADRTTINSSECVNFQWTVRNVKAVYFYPQGANYQQHGVAGESGTQVCPATTTLYELRVIKRDESQEVRQITITVKQQAGVPYIQRFDVYPTELFVGQCLSLSWQIAGAVDRVALVRGRQPLWDYAPTGASYQDCPDDVKTHKYRLQAWGPGGFVEKLVEAEMYPAKQPH